MVTCGLCHEVAADKALQGNTRHRKDVRLSKMFYNKTFLNAMLRIYRYVTLQDKGVVASVLQQTIHMQSIATRATIAAFTSFSAW